MNSDINIHSYKDDSHHTLRGHRTTIVAVKSFGDFVVSGAAQGHILLWDPKTGNVSRPKTLFKHKITVETMTCNSKYVYSCSADLTAA